MTPVRMSKVESSTRHVLAYNQHAVDAILNLLSDDCVFEPVSNGIVFQGKDKIKTALIEEFTSKPKLKIEEIFGLGLHVVMRWKIDGQRGADIFKFRGELICEKHSYAKI